MPATTSIEAALKGQTFPMTNLCKASEPIFKDSLTQIPLPTRSIHDTDKMIPAKSQPTDLRSNLFQVGFEDCASEVIRFLMEQEQMDDSNPMIQGLQSHLRKMSSLICEENISDLDRRQHQQPLNHQYPTNSSSVQHLCQKFTDAQQSLGMTSSDIFSLFEKSPSQLLNAPSSLSTETKSLQSPLKRKHSHLNNQASMSHEDAICSASKRRCHNKILHRSRSSESVLTPCSIDDYVNFTPKNIHSMYNGRIPSHPLSKSSENGLQLPAASIPYPIGQSSPLAPLCPSLSSYSFPPSSFLQSSMIPNSSSTPSSALLSGMSTLPSELLGSNVSTSLSSSSSDDQSSMLELRANFLPGIDTSSLASGNFADVLLAVESCQTHENPRVRELADRIINLVHNEDDDDDDDDEDNEEKEEEEEENVDNDCDENDNSSSRQLEDSGVDLEDDGADWCSPVDMIEL